MLNKRTAGVEGRWKPSSTASLFPGPSATLVGTCSRAKLTDQKAVFRTCGMCLRLDLLVLHRGWVQAMSCVCYRVLVNGPHAASCVSMHAPTQVPSGQG